MTKLPQEELLSAYLDGELTTEEKAQVEKLLAEDPSAQATLDGLREVSSAVQGLPTFKLDENLAANVLKTAERRMLADAPSPRKPDAKAAGEPMWRTVARRFLTPRAIAWSTAIALVAIIITFHNPEEDKRAANGPIAMDMDADREDASRPAVDDMAIHDPGEFRAAPTMEPAPSLAESAPADVEKEELAAPKRLAAKTAKRGMSASPIATSPAAKPPAAKSPTPQPLIADRLNHKWSDKSAMKSVPKKDLKKAEAANKSLADVASKPAAKGAQIERKRKAEPNMGIGPGMGGPGMGPGMGAGSGMGLKGGMGGSMNGPSMRDGMGGPGMGGPGMGMEMGKDKPMPLAEKGNREQLHRKAGKNISSAKRQSYGMLAPDGMSTAGEQPTVTVSCRVDSRLTARKALKQILIAQKLLPQPTTVLDQPKQAPPTNKAPPPNQAPPTEQQKPKQAEETELESLAVRLTPAQLEQVLAEIRKQPKIFGTCKMVPDVKDEKFGLSLGFSFPEPSIPAVQQQAQAAPAQLPQSAREQTVKFKVVFILQPKPAKPAKSQ